MASAHRKLEPVATQHFNKTTTPLPVMLASVQRVESATVAKGLELNGIGHKDAGQRFGPPGSMLLQECDLTAAQHRLAPNPGGAWLALLTAPADIG